jgi:hypothetical protein
MTSNYVVSWQAAERCGPGANPGKGILVTLPEFLALRKSSTKPLLVMTPNTLVENLWVTVGGVDPLWNESDFSVWKIPPAGGMKSESAPGRVDPPFQP